MKKILDIDSQEAKSFLFETRSQDYLVLPEEIQENQIVFGFKKLETIDKPGLVKRWFVSLRAISLTSMFIPNLVIFLHARNKGWDYSLTDLLSAILIPALLLLAVNVLNDVEDHKRLIDLPGTNGGSGVIQKGWITPRSLSYFAYTLISVATLLSIPLFMAQPGPMIIMFLITLMAVMGYSGKPFDFKYKAMGDVVVFFMCGPFLTTAFSLAVYRVVNFEIQLIGILFGLLACAILHANNLNDIHTDGNRGAKTIANKIGFNASKKYMYALYSLAGLTLLSFSFTGGIKPFFLLIFLLPLIPLRALLKKISSSTHPEDESLKDIRFLTPQIHLLTGILLCIILFFQGH